MANELPSFRNPPLIETAVSVLFKPIPSLSNAQLSLIWNDKFRTDFPKTLDAEPITAQAESFSPNPLPMARLPKFRFATGESASRLQMVAEDDQEMIQIQNGRLVYNWRRMSDGKYPRWENLQPRFLTAWNKFLEFVNEQKLGTINPIHWEVVYVNHLEKGSVWNEMSDLGSILPSIIGSGVPGNIGRADSISSNWNLLLPKNHGRLYLELSHGCISADDDSQELMILKLTARGNLDSDCTTDQVIENISIGRSSIVNLFTEVTSPDAHKLWELE